MLAWAGQGFLGPWAGLELIKMQEGGLVSLAEPRKHLSLLWGPNKPGPPEPKPELVC